MRMFNEPITTGRLSELAAARSKIYGLVSSVYLKIPDLEFVRKLMGQDLSLHLTSLSRGADIPKEMGDGFKILKNFIERYKNTSLEELRNLLAVEHVRLFRGVKRVYGPPPPYESVYCDKGLVMGETTAEVKKKYDEAGVSLANNQKGEPPDYIGFELSFMHYLTSEEAKAWGIGPDAALKYLDMESGFLREHLIRWVPDFCDIIVRETKLDFYQSMAKITKSFLGFDIYRIDAIVGMAKSLKQ